MKITVLPPQPTPRRRSADCPYADTAGHFDTAHQPSFRVDTEVLYSAEPYHEEPLPDSKLTRQPALGSHSTCEL